MDSRFNLVRNRQTLVEFLAKPREFSRALAADTDLLQRAKRRADLVNALLHFFENAFALLHHGLMRGLGLQLLRDGPELERLLERIDGFVEELLDFRADFHD